MRSSLIEWKENEKKKKQLDFFEWLSEISKVQTEKKM